MVSHACGCCGKVLDDSSRSHSHALHMWVARGPRCGFAVRWTPRGAREPARVWARLRSLNLRLGVALASLQFAIALLLIAGSYLERLVRQGLIPASPDRALVQLAPVFVGATIAGAAIGLCAATLAPFRRLAVTFVAAWTAAAALVAILALLLLFADSGPERFVAAFLTFTSRFTQRADITGLALGAAIVASVVATVAFGFSVRMAVKVSHRSASRSRRSTSFLVPNQGTRPTGALS